MALAAADWLLATDGRIPDCLFVFAAGWPLDEVTTCMQELGRTLRPRVMIGLNCSGAIAAYREMEVGPALVLWGMIEPDLEVQTTHWLGDEIPANVAGAKVRMVFMDPYSSDCEHLLRLLQQDTGAPLVGGLLSGGSSSREQWLWMNGTLHCGGSLLISMSGPFQVSTVVAQGCRPIGTPMFVTKCEGNLLYELNGESPVKVLEQLYFSLPEKDRLLFRSSLVIGLEMAPFERQHLSQGDFLIRNVVGVDESKGTLVVGAGMEEASVVQFHIRDGTTARNDLVQQLKAVFQEPPCGLLMITCLGRGTRMYGVPHTDSKLIASQWGRPPMAGFFANGEIGPVGGISYLHGYTACLIGFHPKERLA